MSRNSVICGQMPNRPSNYQVQLFFFDYNQCDQMLEYSPNVSKSYPRSSHSSFYIRMRFFKITQKVANNLGYFARNFVTKNFKKSPNRHRPIKYFLFYHHRLMFRTPCFMNISKSLLGKCSTVSTGIFYHDHRRAFLVSFGKLDQGSQSATAFPGMSLFIIPLFRLLYRFKCSLSATVVLRHWSTYLFFSRSLQVS